MQNIATTAGVSYQITFYTSGDNSLPNNIQLAINGVVLQQYNDYLTSSFGAFVQVCGST